MKKYVIVSQHYYPEEGATAQLLTDLALKLSTQNNDLSVVTFSRHSCDSKVHSVNVIRLGSLLTRLTAISNSIIFKLTSGTLFCFLSFLWLLRHTDNRHTVLYVSNPPFIILIAPLVNYLTGSTYHFLQQDLFPRSAVISGILPANGPIIYCINKLFRYAINRGKSLIVLNMAMKKRANIEYAPTSKITVIENWSVVEAKAEALSFSDDIIDNAASPIVLQYSGNLGRLHDILTLLEALRLLPKDQFTLDIIGYGSKHKIVNKYIESFDMSNVNIHPPVPRDRLRSSLANCHMSVVTMASSAFDTVAPSKFYGSLACARPILYVGTLAADIPSYIREYSCGITVDIGDVKSLCSSLMNVHRHRTLLSTYSGNSLRLYKERFGVEVAYKLYKQLLKG